VVVRGRPWRFGSPLPVRRLRLGRSTRRALTKGRRDHRRSQPRSNWWEVPAPCAWGVICIVQTVTHLSGALRSVELAAIAGRVLRGGVGSPGAPGRTDPSDPPTLPSRSTPVRCPRTGRACTTRRRTRAPRCRSRVPRLRRHAGTDGRLRFHARVPPMSSPWSAARSRSVPHLQSEHAERLRRLGLATTPSWLTPSRWGSRGSPEEVFPLSLPRWRPKLASPIRATAFPSHRPEAHPPEATVNGATLGSPPCVSASTSAQQRRSSTRSSAGPASSEESVSKGPGLDHFVRCTATAWGTASRNDHSRRPGQRHDHHPARPSASPAHLSSPFCPGRRGLTVDHAVAWSARGWPSARPWFDAEHRQLGIDFPTTGRRFDRLEMHSRSSPVSSPAEVVSYEGREISSTTPGASHTGPATAPAHLDRLRRAEAHPAPRGRFAMSGNTYGSPDRLRELSVTVDRMAEEAGTADPAAILRASSLSLSEPWDESDRNAGPWPRPGSVISSAAGRPRDAPGSRVRHPGHARLPTG